MQNWLGCVCGGGQKRRQYMKLSPGPSPGTRQFSIKSALPRVQQGMSQHSTASVGGMLPLMGQRFDILHLLSCQSLRTT